MAVCTRFISLVLFGIVATGEAFSQMPDAEKSTLGIEQMDQYLNDRQEMVDRLIAVIEETDSHRREHLNVVRKAIETLGVLRAKEGVDILIKYIGFPWGRHPDGRAYPMLLVGGLGQSSLPIPDTTPAVDALVAIGHSCIPKVIAQLIHTQDNFDKEACIAVLRRLNANKAISDQIRQTLRGDRLEDVLKALAEPDEDRERRLLRLPVKSTP